MDLKDLRRSDNVEDVRGSSGGGRGRGAGLTLGGLAVVLVVSWALGIDPVQLLNAAGGDGAAPSSAGSQTAPVRNDADADFVRAILGDTEDVWGAVFPKVYGQPYPAPKLVLFAEGTTSGCGEAQTSAGPFYCPLDGRVYLDMGFFRYLKATAGHDSQFARAYAIAHEVGHHVQDVLHVLGRVQAKKRGSSKVEANALQVRVELQADCYAGVWGHFTQHKAMVTRADLEVALQTAAQIGDDYLQKQAGRAVTPESFTHGSSAERVSWFTKGFDSGDPKQCDTFAEP